MEHREALLGHWEAIPEGERTAALGGQWYREGRREARALAARHGVSVRAAAGVIAALSPRMRWSVNLTAADNLLAGEPNERVAGYNANVVKARRIANGERPLDVLGGPKVRAFYRAIMGEREEVVVDVWMARAMGVPPEDVSARYTELAAAVADAARAVGVPAADFQALIWVQVRGRRA
jgi:hypothetical protein